MTGTVLKLKRLNLETHDSSGKNRFSRKLKLVLHSYIKPWQTPPNNLSHYQKRRDAMELDMTDFHRLGLFLEGFFFGTISVKFPLSSSRLLKHSNPGIYSGIFAMYLQHHGSQKNTDKVKNILFYALCVLYALSASICIMAIVNCFGLNPVSMDDHGCLTLFQLIVQNILKYLGIVGNTTFACSDFIAQFILVRTTSNSYHSLYSL